MTTGAETVLGRFAMQLAIFAVVTAVAWVTPTLAGTEPKIGHVTNLPLPRFVSLKANEGNVRRGPSLSHRIDWVFVRRNMPLRVIAEHGHWRKVVDPEGATGWIHYALLSGTRTVLVNENLLEIKDSVYDDGRVVARLEKDVVARLRQCTPSQCRIVAGGYKGWAPKSALWGVLPDELRD